MNDVQINALQCAVADLIGAIQIAEKYPRCGYDEDAALETIRELVAAFPDVDFEVPEELV